MKRVREPSFHSPSVCYFHAYFIDFQCSYEHNIVSELQLTSPEESTWEYKAFTKNSAEIMEKLANVLLAARIADKLYADGIIGNDVKQRAHIHAPDVTEIDRVRPIITALKDKIWQNVQIYHRFRGILESSFPSDAETALSYIPEEGKMI